MVRYEVDYWNEDTGERRHERGFVSIQGTIGNHVDRLYDYFGKDSVIEAKIYECFEVLSDTEILEIINKNT